MNEYEQFIQSKRRVPPTFGHEPSDVHPMLFDFQAMVVRWAIRRGRAAIFADCGLGKSLMQLEWARQSGDRVLIAAPLAVAEQTVAEGRKIDLQVRRVDRPEAGSGIQITNYEKLQHFIGAPYDAIVLDESGILKSLDGRTRTMLLNEFTGIPRRLCCTATPAPNDLSELCNHAQFLGVMSRVEMLATFFVHDSDRSGSDGWRLKGHAEDEFWRWVAKWAVYIRKPSDLGFDNGGFQLPPLTIRQEIVQADWKPEGMLFNAGLGGINDRREARKNTISARCAVAITVIEESWTKDKESVSVRKTENDTPETQRSTGHSLLNGERTTNHTSPLKPGKEEGQRIANSEGGGCKVLTGSPRGNTKKSKQSKLDCAQSAALNLEGTKEEEGRSCTSITTMAPESFEGCCASRATEDSDSSMMIRESCIEQPATCSQERWLVWVGLNAEQDSIAAALGDLCVSIEGSTDDEHRIERLKSWESGAVPVLVTKPEIFGFGLNFQFCSRMLFLGIGDSFEKYYQSIRRCWRFGQKQPVEAVIVVSDAEQTVADNVRRKESEAATMAERIVAHARDAMTAEVRGAEAVRVSYKPTKTMRLPEWARKEIAA